MLSGFICVVTNQSFILFFKSWVIICCMYACIYTTFCFSIHHPWTFGLFSPFGYCEKCCCKHWYKISVWTPAFKILLDRRGKSGVTGLRGNSMLNFFVWQWLLLCFIFLPIVHKGSDFSASSPMLIFCFVENIHPNECDVSLWFWSVFPYIWVRLNIFACAAWLSV